MTMFSSFWMANPGGGGYSVDNSIVLDDGSSQYLTGPTLSGGSERIGTYSFWTKRANLGTQQEIYTQYRTSSSNLAFRVRFLSGDTLDIVCENDAGGVILRRTTTQVFRDPHAFLHVHIQIDGNQTDDTCCTLSINGSAVSDFSTKTNLSSGTDLNLFTSSKSAFIGSTPGPAGYYDGYLSEFVVIDANNVAATSFGEYDINGVWQPIELDTATLFPNPTITDNSVNFDGSNDYLTRGGALTGLSDGDAGSTSFWFKLNGGDGSDVSIFTDNAGHVHIRRGSDNKIRLLMHTSGAVELVDIQTSDTYTADGNWHHCMASWNTTSDTQHLYIDGVDQLSVNNSATGTIDYTQTDYAVGARTSGTNKINSDLAEFYFTNEYLDLSQASNRLKFLTATGAPASLGSDGSTPTGTAAVVYLSGATSTWHTNDGTGGGFTENGALTDGSTIQGVYGRNSFYLDASASDHLGRDAVTKDNADATVTYIGSNNDTSNATTYTFSSEPIGTAAANRKVVVITTTSGSPTQGFSSVTINGSSMTKLLQVNNTDNEVSLGIFELEYSSGTTADIVVTASRSTNRMGIDVYNINGAGSYFDSVTASFAAGGTNPSVLTHAVPEGGVSIAAIATENATSTYTWTNLTEDNDEGVELSLTRSTASGAQSSFQSALAVTVSRTSPGTSKGAAFAISWGKGNDLKDINSPTQSSDTCTNNVATLTPLGKNSDVTLSKGNLHCVGSGTNFDWVGSSMTIPSSGKWVFEGQRTTGTNGKLGIGDRAATRGTDVGTGEHFTIDFGGAVEKNGVNVTSVTAPGASVIRVEYDVDTDTIEFFDDGVSVYSGTAGLSPEDGILQFVAAPYASGSTEIDVVFNENDFTGTPTSGFLGLDTTNLYANAAPAIEDGTAHFQATDYTGDGSDGHEINQSGNSRFQPDLLWVKSRSAGSSHCLFDAVRGASERVFSNLTNAQATSTEYLATFDADGFTMNDNSPLGVGDTNADTTTYIGWQWKGDNTSGATNTDGTIPTTVNVNSTAGFSILKYTGNGTDGATIGHGLGAIPDMAFFKRTSDTSQWTVHHKGLTGGISGTYGLEMNTNGKQTITFGAGYADGFTSTVCALQDGSTNATNVNTSGSTYLGIFFTSIPGYSAFGSYEGGINSADGVLALLDFKPAFIMLKNIDNAAGENWFIWDNRRDGYNGANNYLLPNEANLEVTTEFLDIISNGFKIRINDRSVGGTTNTDTIIYAAFAEHPFAGSSPATAR